MQLEAKRGTDFRVVGLARIKYIVYYSIELTWGVTDLDSFPVE